LREIRKDITYVRTSYHRANLQVNISAEQLHEDGRAISFGFDGPWLFSIEVAFTISGVVLARHLCPALAGK